MNTPINYKTDDPEARIIRHAPGFYVIQCRPLPFTGERGETHCPEGPCRISFGPGGVTVEELEAVIADHLGELIDLPCDGPAKSRRGRPRKANTEHTDTHE